ncbi:MAG: hypothetical protein ACTSUN_00805, partial [Promethearchaeota archaeon]
MDVAQFNKILKDKIASAERLENHGEWEKAMKKWLEISDLVLQASKRGDIEFKFKAMLIKKTEQIINHVKELKIKTITPSIPIQEEKMSMIGKEPIIMEEMNESSSTEENFIQKSEIKQKFSPSTQLNTRKEVHSKKEASPIQDEISEEKKIPNGFKEIDAPKDFKI